MSLAIKLTESMNKCDCGGIKISNCGCESFRLIELEKPVTHSNVEVNYCWRCYGAIEPELIGTLCGDCRDIVEQTYMR